MAADDASMAFIGANMQYRLYHLDYKFETRKCNLGFPPYMRKLAHWQSATAAQACLPNLRIPQVMDIRNRGSSLSLN